MRAIDYDMAESFANAEPRWLSNTSVVVEWNKVFMVLHWNIIATKEWDELVFHTPIRYQTKTTLSRLNGILNELEYPIEIKVFKTIWFFVNKETGERTEVLPWPNFISK